MAPPKAAWRVAFGSQAKAMKSLSFVLYSLLVKVSKYVTIYLIKTPVMIIQIACLTMSPWIFCTWTAAPMDPNNIGERYFQIKASSLSGLLTFGLAY